MRGVHCAESLRHHTCLYKPLEVSHWADRPLRLGVVQTPPFGDRMRGVCCRMRMDDHRTMVTIGLARQPAASPASVRKGVCLPTDTFLTVCRPRVDIAKQAISWIAKNRRGLISSSHSSSSSAPGNRCLNLHLAV